MSLISKANRNRLIGFIILIIFTPIILWERGCFAKPEQPTTSKSEIKNTSTAPSVNSINTDSVKQNVTQLNQTNQNSTVKTEIVNGTKIDKQNNYYAAPKPPEDRHVTTADIQRIKKIVPTKYLIALWFCMSDKETYNYNQELNDKLIATGYATEVDAYGIMPNPNPDPRFELDVDTANKKASLFIFPLTK